MGDAQPDALLFNGNVLTMDGGRKASAVAFRSGRVAAVGDSKTLLAEAGANTTLVDLGGRTAVPGFTDAHAHVWKMGHLLTTMLDLRKTSSLASLVEEVRDRDRQLPEGKWLVGRGFNEVAMTERQI